MTTRLTVSSLASPITIKANTTFSAPLKANVDGPFVIALGLTSKGALATVNLKSIGDAAAANTTLILPGASTDYTFKTASGAVTISTKVDATNKKAVVIASLDLTKVAIDTPLVKFTDLTAKFQAATTKLPAALVTLASPTVTLQDTGASATDGITNDGALNVTSAGNTVSYSIDGGKTYTVGSTIPAGTYEAGAIKVVATSSNGSVSKATSIDKKVIIDKTAPTAPTVKITDTGSSATDNLTSDGMITVTGVETGATLALSIDGGKTFTTATADSLILKDGVYAAGQVVVKQTDVAGNSSTTALGALTVDTKANPLSIALATDAGISATDGITNVAKVNVTGLEEGATWQYSVNGADFENGTGTSFTLPADLTYSKGDIMVRQTDKAGNESETEGTNSADWTLETVVPSKLVDVDILDTGIDGDYSTALGKVTVNDLETGATLWYNIDGSTTFVKATGNTFIVPNGTYEAGKIQWKQMDVAGNESPTTLSSVKLVVNDNIPSFDLVAEDGIINAAEKAAGVAISGDVKAGAKSVAISIDGGAAKQAIVNADGTWSYDLLPSDIVSPNLTIKATVTNQDGTVGESDTTDVIVDLEATAPTFNIIAEDGAISYAEKLAGVTITGTTEVGSTVAIAIDGGTEALATVVDGVWNYKLPEAQIKDGTIKITATATDKAGNESVSVDQSVNVLGQIIDINAANTTPYDASTGNFNFYVASGDYTYTINGFGAGDKIDFPAGNAPTVKNDNTTDNAVDLQYANDGKITVLHLTGLTAAQDSTIYSVNSFNTTFGANSVTSTGSSSTPAPVVTNQAVSATGTASASAGNIVFNFAAGSYTYSVSDFASGDGLNFPTDVAPTVINTDVTDKKVDVQWASSGKVISVSVTGLTDAQDGALYSANSFKTLFGANSLTNTGEPPVTPAGNTLSVFAAGSANAGASNVKFAFAAGNYNYTISGYSNGDVLDFPDDVAATVRNTSTTDNSIDVQWASGGNVVVVTLTGLATDTAYSVNSFNAAFGTGSII